MGKLADLAFVDMILGPDFCDVKGVAGTDGQNRTIEADYPADVQRLRELCTSTARSKGSAEFSVVFDGAKLRVTGMVDDGEQEIWLISRTGAEVMNIHQLNLPKQVIDAVMAPDLSGLVLIIGSFGVGKTTTGGSLFAARVEALGGLGLAFEEPPELDMSGPRGKGRIIQIPITAQSPTQSLLERGLRSRAEHFFFGEIRNGSTAIEVQHIAVNDRPIFGTIHAETLWQALMKFQAYCRSKDSSSEALNAMLAESLSVLIHLSLEKVPTSDGGFTRRITPRCLVLGKGDDSARAKIRAGDFRGLVDEVATQGSVRSFRPGTSDRPSLSGSEPTSQGRVPAWRMK